MTRARFLNDLYRLLAGNGMKGEQAEQHLTYYAEMLADRMEEGMAEEQAVASMENVDTIARRILEEEGLAYRPLKEIPMTPPEYPDASRLGGGGGTRAYQVPRKWNWRRTAQIALWTLAVAIALGAVSRWFWMQRVRNYDTGSMAEPEREAVDTLDYAVAEEAAPYAEWYEEYDGWDAPYRYDYEYAGGIMSVDGSTINSINIQWAAGTVLVQSWSGDEIQIQEYARSDLSERTAMRLEQNGGTLSIRYREGTGLGSVKDKKWLTVLVPDGILEELEVRTTSASVCLGGLEQQELEVSSASGDIFLSGCYVQQADLEAVSGEMQIDGIYGEELELSTTSGYISGDAGCEDVKVKTSSGDVTLALEENAEKVHASTISGDVWLTVENAAAQSIGVSTTSGDVSLGVPLEMGFTLEYATVSGELTNNGFHVVRQNGKIVYNLDLKEGGQTASNGGCEIKVETVSGDLDLW